MSVNINLTIQVTGLSDDGQTDAVVQVLGELLRDQSLDPREFDIAPVPGDSGRVRVTNVYGPVSITGFHAWSEGFESSAAFYVHEEAPQAGVQVEWGYPDEERQG